MTYSQGDWKQDAEDAGRATQEAIQQARRADDEIDTLVEHLTLAGDRITELENEQIDLEDTIADLTTQIAALELKTT